MSTNQFPALKHRVRRPVIATLVAVSICSLLLSTTHAQDVFIYPSRGQSATQQSKDKLECSQWATQQTGFDPSRPQAGSTAPYPPPPPAQAPTSSPLRGAAGGAAIGAVGGAIGGDAGKGAAIGAATGALFGGFRRREQMNAQRSQQNAYQQQLASAQAQQAATMDAQRSNYSRALMVCLQGRGYTVN